MLALIKVALLGACGLAMSINQPTIATTPNTAIYQTTITQPQGGIRTVIQGYASVDVFQETATDLNITVENDQQSVVHEEVSNKLKTTINTSTWSAGTYTIITLAAGETVPQTFVIEIQ